MSMWSRSSKLAIVAPEAALPGRTARMPVTAKHVVSGAPMSPPWPAGMEEAMVGMGCFWGAERLFWQLPGVHVTAVGYAGGYTPNPTYQEVCSGQTGHAEVVHLVFDPKVISYDEILRRFWESHDPTTPMSQGNDVGTQYRSALYWYADAQRAAAERSVVTYQQALAAAGRGAISTEVRAAPDFYFAEDYHQQYLAKNPGGYCGLDGTGVACPNPG